MERQFDFLKQCQSVTDMLFKDSPDFLLHRAPVPTGQRLERLHEVSGSQ